MKWRSLEESSAQSQSRSLRDTYAERKALIAKYVPAEIQALHARAVVALQQSGIADRALEPGSDMPEFELLDQNGTVVRSTDLLQSSPLIICFIRGRWCPFCVGQMEAMNAIVPQLQSLAASLVAISPQTVHQNSLTADQHQLRFPLLSDPGNKVAELFGIVYRVPEYQQQIYSRAFVNLPFVNGDDSWQLPIPATYIAKVSRTEDQSTPTAVPQRKIIYAFPNPDYTDRPEPATLLELVGQLQP
jgi:peroxiredoxin